MHDTPGAATLVAFIEARLAEDEAVARAAIDPKRPGTHWHWINGETDDPFDMGGEDFRASLRTVEEFPTTSGVGDLPAFPLGYIEAEETYALPHIARHDPARVLAEVEAWRKIIAGLRDAEAVVAQIGPDLDTPGDTAEWFNYHAWHEMALALASVYANHPDYDETWRP